MRQRFGSRIADEPEVEFYAWKIDDTYFDAYLAWDATRMLKGAFPDFTVRADVYLPGGDAKGDADRLRLYKENGRAASWQDAECRDNINAIFPTLTIGLVSMVQCISSEKLKNNQKRIFRNII